MEKNVPDQDISWEKMIFTWFKMSLKNKKLKSSLLASIYYNVYLQNTAVDTKITNKLLNHVL